MSTSSAQQHWISDTPVVNDNFISARSGHDIAQMCDINHSGGEMKSLNRVFLMGHLGRDPELQTSKSGRQYTRLNVATSRAWKDDEQEKQERTDWHSVFVWGQLAETCASYLSKGALVFVEGTLNQYESEGVASKKQSIHAQSVRFLSRQLDNPEGPRNHDAVVHLS